MVVGKLVVGALVVGALEVGTLVVGALVVGAKLGDVVVGLPVGVTVGSLLDNVLDRFEVGNLVGLVELVSGRLEGLRVGEITSV